MTILQSINHKALLAYLGETLWTTPPGWPTTLDSWISSSWDSSVNPSTQLSFVWSFLKAARGIPTHGDANARTFCGRGIPVLEGHGGIPKGRVVFQADHGKTVAEVGRNILLKGSRSTQMEKLLGVL